MPFQKAKLIPEIYFRDLGKTKTEWHNGLEGEF